MKGWGTRGGRGTLREGGGGGGTLKDMQLLLFFEL